MVYCKVCKKEVEPVYESDRWKCPICNKFIAMMSEEKAEEPRVLESRPVKEMGIPRTIRLNARDLQMGELIIDSGMAKDFNDLVKKSISLLSRSILVDRNFDKQVNGGELNKEPSPEETMKKIQEQEMMKAYIDSLKNKKFDPLPIMMMMKMMKDQDEDKGRITITIK